MSDPQFTPPSQKILGYSPGDFVSNCDGGTYSENHGMATKALSVDLIRIDGDTQNRKSVNEETIADYALTWSSANGQVLFPPLDVFHDGSDYWCADGFHRLLGAIKAKRGSVPCEIHKGGAREAFLFGCHANTKHGLRRSNADKRFAVERLLSDDEWCKLSARKLSEMAGVSHQYVLTVKNELLPSNLVSTVDTKSGGGNSKPRKKRNKSKSVDASSGNGAVGAPGGDAPSSTSGGEEEPEAVEADSSEACAACGSLFYVKSSPDSEFDTCRDCGHLFGEPAKLSKARVAIRLKAIKTGEAFLRAIDDLHADRPRNKDHAKMIECITDCLKRLGVWDK